MLKSVKTSLLGATMLLVSGLQSVQATPVLVQDFWGKDAQNQQVHFARLVVDTQTATPWSGSFYQTTSWQSFTIFGENVQTPAFNFLAEFDVADLMKGFTFLQFDVSDVNNQYNFFGIHLGDISSAYYELRLADLPYTDPQGEVFAGSNVIAPTATVDAPSSLGMLAITAAFVAWRRRLQSHHTASK